MSALLRSQLEASLAASAPTEAGLRRRLLSEARATLTVLRDALPLIEERLPITGERLRLRTIYLREAVEAVEAHPWPAAPSRAQPYTIEV